MYTLDGNNTLYVFYLQNGGKLKAENMSNDGVANPSRCWCAFSGVNGTSEEFIEEYSDKNRGYGATGISTDGYIEFPSTVKMVVFAHFNKDTNPLRVYKWDTVDTNGVIDDVATLKTQSDNIVNMNYVKENEQSIDYGFDEKPIISKFFSEREHLRDNWISPSSKTIYWDNKNGLDSNDGLTENTPILTFAKVKELISDGDTLKIKYGTIITDICTFDKILYGIRIDAYGDSADGNPIFDNLVTISSSDIEKVNGYNYIYRIKHRYEKSKNNVTNMQCFVDGVRLGKVKMGSTGYATTSNKYIIDFDEAMSILESNPGNEAWFSGYETSEEWEEGDYYFYFSLSDEPANHKIEITNHTYPCLLDMFKLVNTDMRHINTRGSAGKDGWNIGTNTYMEDCHIYDHAHHGFLSFNGYQRAYKCSAESKSGAIGMQFHHFGTDDSICMNAENIYINCSVISERQAGGAFGGHMGSANSICYINYIIDCYVENCSYVAGGTFVKEHYIKNIIIKNTSCILTKLNKAYIEHIRGSLYNSQKTSLNTAAGFNGEVIANDIILKLTTYNGIGGLLFETDDTVTPKGKYKDCIFLIYKTTMDSTNPSQTLYPIYININSNYFFENCVVAIQKSDDSYEQKLLNPNRTSTNIKMKNCVCFGFINNSDYAEDSNYFDNCQFGVDNSEMGELKWLQRTAYFDNGIMKRAII